MTKENQQNVRRVQNGSIDQAFYMVRGRAKRSEQTYQLLGLFKTLISTISDRIRNRMDDFASQQHEAGLIKPSGQNRTL